MFTASSSPVAAGTPRYPASIVRTLALTASLAIAVLALTFGPAGANAFAATQDLTQCNGLLGGGGQELDCTIDVVNNLDLATGTESSTVTTTVCQGPNSAPICGQPVTTSYNLLTKSVDQCNGSVNGGGSTLTCRVTVVNNITGAPENSGTTGATVNQCNYAGTGGGTAPTLNCDPFPASVSGATITQCNYSVNGGGAPDRVTCTVVDPSTVSALLPVTVNQCNDSANGGGSLVTCSVKLTNTITTVAASTTPTPVATTPAKNVLHDSKTDGFDLVAAHDAGTFGGTAFLGAGILVLLASGLLTLGIATRKADARR
ncbi:hypothetical protein QMG61_13885 [Cryobacterium sp. PH31-AA6]|uniref:hypothetical protein n=1 Tax=Cryobacterium sp. PH31-AA6 TaxID=3046205 RepID=UPI0024BB7529|nr:hypothetical protein [Cryobacterium sp. PH31-AA6]MDJ0324849.1 hypothetical protein [Cryobacterium sp. PH31-AA6]